MHENKKKIITVIAMILAIIILNHIIHSNEEYFINVEKIGYLGVFISCILLNATVLLPSSSTAVVMTMSTIYNPIIVAFFGALGATIGEFTGYFVGYYGQNVLNINKRIHKLTYYFDRCPSLAIIIFAILPLPLFDFFGILAGSTKMPKYKFFLFCFIGKLIKMELYAWLGEYTLEHVLKLFT